MTELSLSSLVTLEYAQDLSEACGRDHLYFTRRYDPLPAINLFSVPVFMH